MDNKGSRKTYIQDADVSEPVLRRKPDTELEGKEEHVNVSKQEDARKSARENPAGNVLYHKKDDMVDMTINTSTSEAKVEDEADHAKSFKRQQQYFPQVARECTIIHENGIVLYKTGSYFVAQLISPHQMSTERSVFSVKILKAGEIGEIGIGLVPENYPPNCMPGWEKNSYGYHADDGGIYEGKSGFSTVFGQAKEGDTMSIEVDKAKKIGYFKRNSDKCTAVNLKIHGLYPCIGIRSNGAAVQLMTKDVWESENDVWDHPEPDALPLCRLNELFIGPAEEVSLLEYQKNKFFGWLLVHNPGTAKVYFKVIYGRNPDHIRYGILGEKEHWLDHLEIEREDIRDNIIIEWTLPHDENCQMDPQDLKYLLGPNSEHKNYYKLLVKKQNSEELADEEASNVNAESKELLQFLKLRSTITHDYETAVKKVEELTLGADNLDIKDESGYTSLHLAASFKVTRIAHVLLNANADPHVKNREGELPLDIALYARDDEMAELLVRKMKQKSVCELFWNCTEIKQNLKKLLEDGLEKTVPAVLDSFIRHDYCCVAPLELDDKNRSPNCPDYNDQYFTAYKMIVTRESNKALVSHTAIKALSEMKWNSYAKKIFVIMALIYLLSLFSISFAAITGVITDDVTQYHTPIDVARAVFEMITLLAALATLVVEAVQMNRHRCGYFKDVYNYMELSSSILIISVLPLRYANCQEQWYVFAVGYIIWGFRIFKYAAMFRPAGIFELILLRLVTKDVPQFLVLFLVILVSFSGGLFLSLKGDNNLTVHSDTSTFLGILFVGIRTLTETGPVVDYTGTDGYRTVSCILMLVFLFLTCVLLINIFIAQLSDRYTSIKTDAEREFEEARVKLLNRVENDTNFLYLYFGKRLRKQSYTDYARRRTSCESEHVFDANRAIQKLATDLKKTHISLAAIQENQEELQRKLNALADKNT